MKFLAAEAESRSVWLVFRRNRISVFILNVMIITFICYSAARANSFPSGQVAGTVCLLYTSPSPRDGLLSRMPSSA